MWVKVRPGMCSPRSLYIGCVYIPHEYRSLRTTGFNYFESLQDDIAQFKPLGDVLIVGDCNARTGAMDDYIRANPFGDLLNHIDDVLEEAASVNVDSIVNTLGRKLIELCKITGMQIRTGRHGPVSDNYTCYRYNGRSVIDYLITIANVANHLTVFKIGDRTVSSDHCPIIFALPRFGLHKILKNAHDSISKRMFKWDIKYKDAYCCDLLKPKCRNYVILLMKQYPMNV